MTNGGGPAHGPKRAKKLPGKKVRAAGTGGLLRRKGWLPDKLAKGKGG